MPNARLILEPEANILAKINKVILRRINQKIRLQVIKEVFVKEFRISLESNPAWISLLSNKKGSLTGDFGLRRGEITPALLEIMERWIAGITISQNSVITKQRFTYTITLKGLPSDFSDVLGMKAAQTISKGEVLPWLEWLALKGHTEIIQGYHVVEGKFDQSRSGKAIMRKTGSFSVNPTYAGTRVDNFITRTVKSMNHININTQIITEIKRALR